MEPNRSSFRRSRSTSKRGGKSNSRSRLFRDRFRHSRPTEPGDLKYAYAAWKMGRLELPGFEVDEDATKDEFIEAFYNHLISHYQAHFTLEADSLKGRHIVGLLLAVQPMPGKKLIMIGDIVWFPWASKRNKLEMIVHWINVMRSDFIITEFALNEHQNFWDHVCRYGVLRRAGTLHDLHESGPSPVYQSRKIWRK